MEKTHSVYLALGSNIDNKVNNLQKAVELLHRRVGKIELISELFTTEAVGFKGEDFLNCCLSIETMLPAESLIQKLLKIEEEMGRQRPSENVLASRVIDLDILFYDDQEIKKSDLEIPHPRLHQRNFVLIPLKSIAPSLIHPLLNKTIEQLEVDCEDTSEVQAAKQWLRNPSKTNVFNNFNYVAIEGNIGAGKTSLAKLIANEHNAKLILERFADNPFLPKFYDDPQRYAFTLEMSFLADRYRQINDDLSQLDLFKDFIVSDYDVFKSLIFSKITLPPDEFQLYRTLFYQMFKDISKPDLYIYLYQSMDRLKENIAKRGRDYEMDIDVEYLDKINKGYLEFIKEHKSLNVKIIDIGNRDFLLNREDYIWVLDQAIS